VREIHTRRAFGTGRIRANREGRLIDLFTKAIDQLASDKITVRHGGVYALEQLADLDPRYRGHAHDLLTAFVRTARRGHRRIRNRRRTQTGQPPMWASPTTSRGRWPCSAGS
jgi:hypothetical protein